MSRSTYATIDCEAIAHNLSRVREASGPARVMAVVKADAYGHGLERCIPALIDADMLAVATLDEARAVRTLAPDASILLLEGVMAPGELVDVAGLGVELVVHHPGQIEWLERTDSRPGRRVWLKIDTGMHRLGFGLPGVRDAYRRLRALDGIDEVVLMTHLACADEAAHRLNRVQIEAFDEATRGLNAAHCIANSAAMLNLPDTRRDWVRAGLLVYGVSPLVDRNGPALGLKPAMTLETRLMAVNEVAAGDSVGYGARYRSVRDSRIGVAAIGYGDGYPRNMPDGAPVLVNGREQVLAGRVSMDMLTIDLEDQPEAQIGDPVVLWGRGLPIERVAAAVGTIPYELLCRVTRRVPYRDAREALR